MIETNKAQQYINATISLLECVEVPVKRSRWEYEEGSDTVESYLSSLRVARQLILKAMNEVRKKTGRRI